MSAETVDASWHRGDWMQTYTGGRFWPMDPKPEDVSPIDIAHALSMLCRYNGHVERFYSVAEHCVLLCDSVAPENALWALLHDATEAYVGDMIRPLKRSMPDYVEAEARVMTAIVSRFGLVGEIPAEVKEADTRILINEKAALLPNAESWAPLAGMDPLPVTINGWPPATAESFYLSRLRLWMSA